MDTAPSGLDDTTNTDVVSKKTGRWRGRRRSIFAGAIALAVAAAATVVVVGGDAEEAEATPFGIDPPPATETLCETDLPSQADHALGNNTLDWPGAVTVDVDLFEVNGDATDILGNDVNTDGFLYRDRQPVATSTTYTYSVVLDNTGDPFDPDVNNHPSYHPMSSASPIVVTGGGTGSTISVDLPPGCRYMMSVRAVDDANGRSYDIGGSWIRIETDPHAYGTGIQYQANDVDLITNDRLPFTRATVRAFHDFAQTNAQFDPGEPGLGGFDVFLGDGGEQAVDWFGNPICTNYEIGLGDPTKLDAPDLDIDGMPTIAASPGGNCLTDSEGHLTINYLSAGKYELVVIPPDTSNWVQTTTIEGSHVIDIWVDPANDGIGGEFIGDIDAGTFQAVGFVSPDLHPTWEDNVDALNDPVDLPAAGNPGVVDTNGDDINYRYPYVADPAGADITGCFFNGQLYPTADGIKTLVQNGSQNYDGNAEPLFNSYVALNDVGNHDSMMGLAETDDNGCFEFSDVPEGSYQLAVWDYELYYIINFYNVTVNATTATSPDAGDVPGEFVNSTVDMGDNFVLRWFGWSSGYVFYDNGVAANGTPITTTRDGSAQAAANGVRDCLNQHVATFSYDTAPVDECEAGIPEMEVLIRNRDGSIFKGGVTNNDGFYEIPNIWSPMFRMQVLEVGAGAMDFTGHSVHNQFDRTLVASQGNCDTAIVEPWVPAVAGRDESCLPADAGGGLLLSSIFQQGKRNEVDFGKLSYLDPNAPNGFFGTGAGHGGIAGGVVQTTTRAEWAGSLSGAEDNETGVPSATVRLLGYDAGCTDVDPVTGDSGTDNPDCYTVQLAEVQTDSYSHPGLSRDGQTCTIPSFDGSDFGAINATFDPLGEECTGSWLVGAHTKDGAWNGGFAFAELDGSGDPLPFGFYVVEVDPPAGYQIVKENDLNTAEGNNYVPALPPAGCVGEWHYAQLDAEYGSPYDAFDDGLGGDGSIYNTAAPVRLCDRRMLRVQPFRNAAVDMMLMTTGMDREWTSNHQLADNPATPDYDESLLHQVDPYELQGVDPDVPAQQWQSVETVPMPGRWFGLVLDDLTMTANQNSLTFGEQQGAAYIPIGFYDHTGNHITTIWTDENGHYEVLLPSTYSINRATPGGVGPQMYEVVVNDHGQTHLPGGAKNWGYDATYITNPVIRDTWPGIMTKADTPVLSLAAGPCSMPTGTPQLFEVTHVEGHLQNGGLPADYTAYGENLAGTTPWFTPMLGDGTLDTVPANAIDLSPYITASITHTLVDGSQYDEIVIDLDALETGVNPDPGAYHLSFDDGTDLGSSPRNTVTFHMRGDDYDLDVFEVTGGASIQDTIEDAIANGEGDDGSLVVVPPGTYRESLVVHGSPGDSTKGIVIQGHGSGGIIGVPTEQGPIGQVETPFAQFTGSVVSPFGSMLDNTMFDPWEALIAGSGPNGPITWDGNQNVEIGPAFQVLLSAGEIDAAAPFQIDGFGVTGGRAQNGMVHVNGEASGLVVSNMAIQANNASQGGAGVNLGVHSLENMVEVGSNGTHERVNGRVVLNPGPSAHLEDAGGTYIANNTGMVIRDNRILQNGGTSLAGGVGILGDGNEYRFIDNNVCGNFSAEYGGGLSHNGVSTGVIAGNVFENNEAFDEGGAIFIGSEVTAGNPLGNGIGSVVIERNQILYNLSGDDGGGIMALFPLNDPITVVNNFIANNVATDIGGGMHLAHSGNAATAVVHNTFANNMSVSGAGDSGGMDCDGAAPAAGGVGNGLNTCPRAGGFTTEPHSADFLLFGPADLSTFSDPDLRNNIFWNNQAGVVTGNADDEGNIVEVIPGIADMGVYDDATPQEPTMELDPQFSVLTTAYGAATNNVVGLDPAFVLDLPLTIKSQPGTVIGQIADITMVWPGGTAIEESDYHIAIPSPAIGLADAGVTPIDIDGDARTAPPDSGADEVDGLSLAGLMAFSTVRGFDDLGGTLFGDDRIQDHDVQLWTSTGISTLLEGLAGGLGVGGRADIDGLHVVSTDEFYVSFLVDNVQLPGGPIVNDEDIVHVDASGLTPVWTLAVDGSDLGLTNGSRDIDALHRLDNGDFLVSFTGRGGGGLEGYADLQGSGGPFSVQDEDVVRMVVLTGGATTTGYFEPYFVGAFVGLDVPHAADVDGVALINGGADLLLSIKGPEFEDGDFEYQDEDVFVCAGVTIVGGFVDCGLVEAPYFDGSAVMVGLHPDNDVNAISGPVPN